MTFPRTFVAALVAAALAPAAAPAADVRVLARDEPVGRGVAATRALAARPAPAWFNLVGVHWRGPGTVSFRVAWRPGRWSAWRPARPEDEDLPDPGSGEASRRPGWNVGNPYWTGPARHIQYRLTGRVRGLRAYFLWSEPGETATLAKAVAPPIIRRAQWGANESIVRAGPAYAESVRFAVVHHTAGSNSYTATQSAAIVRGIQAYHVKANGWNDIGYNFLVDKYGQVFEGRAGGIDRNVIGAHAQGFNTGSVGVAVLGTYGGARISSTASSALTALLAWRLDVAHADPLARVTWLSGGNPRYPAGTPVRLRVVSGHRDTGPTTCPGDGLYAQLPGIATAAAARGLPKLYDPVVAGGLGGPVRITARLSASLPWTVTVHDAAGVQVARTNGLGATVDATWNATGIFFGSYTWRIDAGPDVRPASGRVPGPPPLAVTRVAAAPRIFTPNGDGAADATSVSFTLTAGATADVTIADSSGHTVRTLAAGRAYGPGTWRLRWDGTAADGRPVADGRYTARVVARSSGQESTGQAAITVDRTLGFVSVSPHVFSPNGDRRVDATTASFRLAREARVAVHIRTSAGLVATIATATLPAGAHSVTWDGRASGRIVADGPYLAAVAATGPLGTRSLRVPVAVDTVGPAVRIVAARVVDGRTRLRLRLSEAATLKIWYGPRRWYGGGVLAGVRRNAGVVRVVLPAPAGGVRVIGVDAAANRGRPAVATVPR